MPEACGALVELVAEAGKGNPKSSYHGQLLWFMEDESFNAVMVSMPEGLRVRHGVCVLSLALSRLLIRKWIPGAIKKIQEQPSVGDERKSAVGNRGRPPNRAGEVNRFVGWAIPSLIKQQRKKLDGRKKEHDGEIDDEDIVLQRLTLLESLRVFEHEILEDIEYLRKYYAGGFRLYNNGWLALVKPSFASIGHDLVDIIAEAVTQEKLETLWEGCIERARKEVWREVEAKKIDRRFLQHCGEVNMRKEDKLKVFRDLVLKVSNARFGYE